MMSLHCPSPTRYVFTCILFFFSLSIATARMIKRDPEYQKRSRMDLSVIGDVDRICQPESLSQAVKCACFAHSAQFTDDDISETTKRMCSDVLKDEKSGYSSCRNTKFMGLTGMFNFSAIHRHFNEVMENCMNLGFEHLGSSGITREKGSMSRIQQHKAGSPVVPLTSRVSRNRLSHICLVVAQERGLSGEEALRACLASGSKPQPQTCNRGIPRSACECGCHIYLKHYDLGPLRGPIEELCRLGFGNRYKSSTTSCFTFMRLSSRENRFNMGVLENYFKDPCTNCVGGPLCSRNSRNDGIARFMLGSRPLGGSGPVSRGQGAMEKYQQFCHDLAYYTRTSFRRCRV